MSKRTMRDECADLGYNDRNKDGPKYFTKIMRLTGHFYNLSSPRLNDQDLRDEYGEDLKEMCEQFLEAKCSCRETQFRDFYGQKHGQLLWPMSGEITVHGKSLIYPEHKEEIISHLRPIFMQKHDTKMYNRRKNELERKDPAASRKRVRKSEEEISDIDSTDDSIAEEQESTFSPTNAPQHQSISTGPKKRHQKRLKFTSSLDIYLSSLYPSMGLIPSVYHNPGNAEEPYSLSTAQSNLLFNEHYDWLEESRLFIERYLHEHDLYVTEGDTDQALKDLVTSLKTHLNFTCDDTRNGIIAKKCNKFIKDHTHEWVYVKNWLEHIGTYPGPLKLRQSSHFSKKLESYREKYSRDVPNSEDLEVLAKRQRTGNSTYRSRQTVESDGDPDADPVSGPDRSMAPNSLPPTPRSAAQSHSGSQSGFPRNNLGVRQRERSISPGTVQPFSPLEQENSFDLNEYMKRPRLQQQMSCVRSVPDRPVTEEAPAAEAVRGPSRQQDSAPKMSISSRIPKNISNVPILPTPRPTSITLSNHQGPEIEIVLKQLQPVIQYSNPHKTSILQGSVHDFFALYSQESRIPQGDFEQLEFDFPNATIRRKRNLENNEKSWMSLKSLIKGLFSEAIRESADKGKDLVTFEIRVEAVAPERAGWSWNVEKQLESMLDF